MIAKYKIPYTPQHKEKILSYLRFVAVCAELIKVEYQDFICDVKFKDPNINNHAKRIVESAEAISRSLSQNTVITDREAFLYQSTLQMHRIVKHFMGLTVGQVEEFMDLVDEEIRKGTDLCSA